MKYRIKPAFKRCLRPLRPDERERLKESIKKYGCREPICTWHGWIFAGHNRAEICQELGIQPEVIEMDSMFETDEEVIKWIFEDQLGKRNLSPKQASYYRGRLNNMQKAPHGDQKRFASGQNDLLGKDTNERLAEQFGVSPKTIQRDGKFAEAVDELAKADPAVVDKVLAGDMTKKQVFEKVNGDPLMKPPPDAGDQWEAPSQERLKELREAAKEARKRGPSGRETMKAKEAIDALGHAYNRVTRYASDRGVLPFLDKVQKQLRATGDLFEAFTKEYP